jgi:hypothetical protein
MSPKCCCDADSPMLIVCSSRTRHPPEAPIEAVLVVQGNIVNATVSGSVDHRDIVAEQR